MFGLLLCKKEGVIMALYNVEVIEKLRRVVEQEADSYEIPEELIATKYADEEIVFDWEDFNNALNDFFEDYIELEDVKAEKNMEI